MIIIIITLDLYLKTNFEKNEEIKISKLAPIKEVSMTEINLLPHWYIYIIKYTLHHISFPKKCKNSFLEF